MSQISIRCLILLGLATACLSAILLSTWSVEARSEVSGRRRTSKSLTSDEQRTSSGSTARSINYKHQSLAGEPAQSGARKLHLSMARSSRKSRNKRRMSASMKRNINRRMASGLDLEQSGSTATDNCPCASMGNMLNTKTIEREVLTQLGNHTSDEDGLRTSDISTHKSGIAVEDPDSPVGLTTSQSEELSKEELELLRKKHRTTQKTSRKTTSSTIFRPPTRPHIDLDEEVRQAESQFKNLDPDQESQKGEIVQSEASFSETEPLSNESEVSKLPGIPAQIARIESKLSETQPDQDEVSSSTSSEASDSSPEPPSEPRTREKVDISTQSIAPQLEQTNTESSDVPSEHDTNQQVTKSLAVPDVSSGQSDSHEAVETDGRPGSVQQVAKEPVETSESLDRSSTTDTSSVGPQPGTRPSSGSSSFVSNHVGETGPIASQQDVSSSTTSSASTPDQLTSRETSEVDVHPQPGSISSAIPGLSSVSTDTRETSETESGLPNLAQLDANKAIGTLASVANQLTNHAPEEIGSQQPQADLKLPTAPLELPGSVSEQTQVTSPTESKMPLLDEASATLGSMAGQLMNQETKDAGSSPRLDLKPSTHSAGSSGSTADQDHENSQSEAGTKAPIQDVSSGPSVSKFEHLITKGSSGATNGIAHPDQVISTTITGSPGVVSSVIKETGELRGQPMSPQHDLDQQITGALSPGSGSATSSEVINRVTSEISPQSMQLPATQQVASRPTIITRPLGSTLSQTVEKGPSKISDHQEIDVIEESQRVPEPELDEGLHGKLSETAGSGAAAETAMSTGAKDYSGLYESPKVNKLPKKCRIKLRRLKAALDELLALIERIGQNNLLDSKVSYNSREALSRRLAKIRRSAAEARMAAHLANLSVLNEAVRSAGQSLVKLSNSSIARKFEPTLRSFASKLRVHFAEYREMCKKEKQI